MPGTDDRPSQPATLAERLFMMRKAARLTGIGMAEQLGWAKSKISKLENARQMPTADDITRWAAACGHAEEVPELLEMLAQTQVTHRQWRHLHTNRGQAGIQKDLDEIVRRAAHIRNFEVTIIPGLLQTADYARYIYTEIARVYETPLDGIDAAVAARMRRQEVLYEQGKQFEFVISEAAFWFHTCPVNVLLGQVDRLMNLSGLGNIKIGVIPFAAELTITPLHGFLIADGQVSIETYAADITLRNGEAAVYGPIASALMDEAVSGEEAQQLLAEAAARLRGQ